MVSPRAAGESLPWHPQHLHPLLQPGYSQGSSLPHSSAAFCPFLIHLPRGATGITDWGSCALPQGHCRTSWNQLELGLPSSSLCSEAPKALADNTQTHTPLAEVQIIPIIMVVHSRDTAVCLITSRTQSHSK